MRVCICVFAELNQLTDDELREKARSLKNLSFQLAQEEGLCSSVLSSLCGFTVHV